MLNSAQQSIKYGHNEVLKAETGSSRTDKMMRTTKQGIVTETFISNRESENSIFKDTPLPADLRKSFQEKEQAEKRREKSADKQFLAMIGIPLVVLGAGALVTEIMAGVFKKKLHPGLPGKSAENNSLSKLFGGIKKLFTDPEKGPVIPPQMNLTKETEFAAYEALRDPNLKKMLGATAVFTYTAAAFVLKSTVDGLKDIWVKQNEADIRRNFQEKMIDIETRSFAGKKQTVRYLLDRKTKELDSINKARNIAFTGNKEKEHEQNESNSGIKPFYVVTGLAAVGASVLLIRKTLKNIREIGKTIEKAAEKIPKQANKKPGSSSWAPVHGMYGDPNGRPTVFGILNDASAHVYNMFMNPSKFTGLLATGMSAVAGIGYAGTKFVDGNREIQVKKANAQIDLDMNDKLVPVELENFLKKKEAAVSPLINDYKTYSDSHSEDMEGLKSKYKIIINEIKNGPPFIYD